MKLMVERDAASIGSGGSGLLDRAFIAEHTCGIEALNREVEATSWDVIIRQFGLTRAAIESAADVYASAAASFYATEWASPSTEMGRPMCSRQRISCC